MSHGDHATHTKTIIAIRAAEKKTKSHIAILIDLSGPKIRTGNFTTETITLQAGKIVTLTTESIVGDINRFSISYKKLPTEITKKSIIMIHDGKIKLAVTAIKKTEIICKILVGGTIKGRRGVNIINGSLSVSSLTKKDKLD
jgi:pyruvate kinase